MFSIEENKLVSYNGSDREEIVLPEGVVTVCSHAFYGHRELRRVVLSGTVRTLGDAAFKNCENLTEIVFPEGLKRVGAACFAGCVSLQSANLPDQVASVRAAAFSGCRSLSGFSVPSGLRRSIESGTFSGCVSLKHVSLPSGVSLVSYKAFSDCTALETVTFGNPQVRVERGAFVGCSSLSEASVQLIEERTFSSVVIDIRSSSRGAAGILSNFIPRRFVFDGVACGSLEGVLQSLKCQDPARQKEICKLAGSEARLAGLGLDWQTSQTLYWRGEAYPRESEAYQHLLDRLYETVFEQDASFREALAEVRGRELSHRLGRTQAQRTILTRNELTSRLERLSLLSVSSI